MSTYYKNPNIIFLNDVFNANGTYNFCGEGIKSYQLKRGVSSPVELENTIKKIKLLEIRRISGKVQYGSVVDVYAYVGDLPTRTTIEEIDFFNFAMKYGVVDGEINGNFAYIFKGVTSRLIDKDTDEYKTYHRNYVNELNKKEEKLKKSKNLILEPNTFYTCELGRRYLYLGEEYMQNPTVPKKYYKTNDIKDIKITKETKYHVLVAFQPRNENLLKEVKFLRSSNELLLKLKKETTSIQKTKEQIYQENQNWYENFKKENYAYNRASFYDRRKHYDNLRHFTSLYLLSLSSNVKENSKTPIKDDLIMYAKAICNL